MKNSLIKFCLFLSKQLWKLRYRVTYKGLDIIKKELKDSKNGILFLPNHPAIVIDPMVVSVPLVEDFSVRPLVIEYMYYNPLFHWAIQLLNALPIPNFATGYNPIKLRRTEQMLQKMSDGLKNGERFLIYPSGTTKVGPKEILGGSFGTHKLLSENPDIEIILVRMTGLWGSMFSRALTAGEVANPSTTLKHALISLLKNGIFFMPKRDVLVEFERMGDDFPRRGSLEEVNQYLEKWYNKPFTSLDGKTTYGEPLKLVSYLFWKDDFPQIKKRIEEKVDTSQIPEDTKKKILKKIAELARLTPEQVAPSQSLIADLGLDSLDVAELITFLEDEFEVSGINPGDLTSVQRVFLIAGKIYKKREVEEKQYDLTAWLKKKGSHKIQIPDAETIPEAFLKSCDADISAVSCADPIAGILTRFDMKKRALLLSQAIRKLPGKRIGILLPASTTVNILIFACQLAGKTPVMINWTIGGKHLDTVVEVSGFEVVLTAWSFLDNLENVDITRIEKMILVLEEMRATIGLKDIIKATYLSYFSAKSLLQREEFLHLKKPGATFQEAVILFTSGTEANPKGVPLSHHNLLSNQKEVLSSVALTADDRMISMLPAFHSFGFAITGIMPLISGLRVVFFPNPTDSKRLSKAIKTWKPTIVCSAPTFLKNIIQAADLGSLSSLRLIVSGAERAPDDLFSLMAKATPKAQFYEGYGITECSPVLTLNIQGRQHGVGQPLHGVSLVAVDPESYQELEKDTVGLILASGPNVFSGYLNKDVKSPFIDFKGSSWYNTGDLGKLLKDGSLVIAGRMKRFVKIGGEMISLTAIEDAFSPLVKVQEEKEGLPQISVMAGAEDGGRPKLYLFSKENVELAAANQMLRKSGFSNLVKIDKVCTIEAIPMTATGKVAYRQLDKIVKSYQV